MNRRGVRAAAQEFPPACRRPGAVMGLFDGPLFVGPRDEVQRVKSLFPVLAVPAGEVLVLGGLNDAQLSGSKSEPFLLPALLRRTAANSKSVEVVVALRVEVVGGAGAAP